MQRVVSVAIIICRSILWILFLFIQWKWFSAKYRALPKSSERLFSFAISVFFEFIPNKLIVVSFHSKKAGEQHVLMLIICVPYHINMIQWHHACRLKVLARVKHIPSLAAAALLVPPAAKTKNEKVEFFDYFLRKRSPTKWARMRRSKRMINLPGVKKKSNEI